MTSGQIGYQWSRSANLSLKLSDSLNGRLLLRSIPVVKCDLFGKQRVAAVPVETKLPTDTTHRGCGGKS